MKKYVLTAALIITCSLIFAQVEMGGTSNYSEIEPDGTLEFHGDATVWDDFVVDPSTTSSQNNAPDFEDFVSSTLKAFAFDGGNTMEQVFFDVQLPHSWEEGSRIYPHIHWAPADGSGGDVVWNLEYTWANIDGTFGTPQTINSDPVPAGNTAFTQHVTPIPASGGIDGTGKEISSVLRCRLFRNPSGSDTYSGDAFALSIDFHYKLNTVGSRQEYVK